MVGGGVLAYHDLAVGANSGHHNWLVYYSDGNDPLALVYQTLARQKPELEGGIYSYARAGFGNILDLVLGDMVSRNLGNVATIMLLFSTLGYFFPF